MICFLIIPTNAIGAAIFHLHGPLVNRKLPWNLCRLTCLSAGFCEF